MSLAVPRRVAVTQKEGQRRRCQVSTQEMNAIRDYLDHERARYAER